MMVTQLIRNDNNFWRVFWNISTASILFITCELSLSPQTHYYLRKKWPKIDMHVLPVLHRIRSRSTCQSAPKIKTTAPVSNLHKKVFFLLGIAVHRLWCCGLLKWWKFVFQFIFSCCSCCYDIEEICDMYCFFEDISETLPDVVSEQKELTRTLMSLHSWHLHPDTYIV
jgi:hypothetical protein